jgi:hypothetical protein
MIINFLEKYSKDVVLGDSAENKKDKNMKKGKFYVYSS